MSTSTTPRLEDIFLSVVRKYGRSTFGGWMPGRVVDYDAGKRKASVMLLLRDTHPVTGEPLAYAIINEVPVMMPFHIKAPVKAGFDVLVLFGARSTDRWVQQGGVVDPDDTRTHDINDALAIPGLMDFAHVVDADPGIEFTDSEIHAGGTEELALKSDVTALKSALVTILGVIATQVGSSGTPAGATAAGLAIAAAIAGPAPTAFSIVLTGIPAGTDVLKGG